MSKPDLNAVRAAEKSFSFQWNRSDPYAMMAYGPAAVTIVDYYFDPTPLTAELLASMKPTIIENGYWWPGGLTVEINDGQIAAWYLPGHRSDVPVDRRIAPRTLGELRQLVERLETR